MALIEDLQWRYAAKRMNGKAFETYKVERILDAIQLSASSYGLQPYSILVVTEKELREKLQPAIWNQPQVVEGSHLLVFAAWKEVSVDRIDAYIRQIAKVRGMTLEALAPMREKLVKRFAGMSTAKHFEWAARQTYIALGTGLVAAAEQKVDSTPMEGFDPAEVDKILGLEEKGLGSTTLLVLGYRDEDKDHLSDANKVRRPQETLVEWR